MSESLALVGFILFGRPAADTAVLCRGGVIEAIGADSDVEKMVTSTTIVVRGGGTQLLCPGFVDSHVHLFDAGRRLTSVSLCGARDRKPNFASGCLLTWQRAPQKAKAVPG